VGTRAAARATFRGGLPTARPPAFESFVHSAPWHACCSGPCRRRERRGRSVR
jgi:hypothetical protein